MEDQQEDALRVIVIAATKRENALQLTRAGTTSKVVNFLSSNDEILIMLACWALNNITVHGDQEIIDSLRATPVINRLQQALNLSTRDVLIKATWCMTNLSRDPQFAKEIVKEGLHESLIKLMEDYNNDYDLNSYCLDPLNNLLVQDNLLALSFAKSGVIKLGLKYLNIKREGNQLMAKTLRFFLLLTLSTDSLRQLMVSENILSPLNNILESDEITAELKAVALRLINNLAAAEANENELLGSGCFLSIVGLLNSHSQQQQQQQNIQITKYAASVLANLSSKTKFQETLRHYGWIDPILSLLSSPLPSLSSLNSNSLSSNSQNLSSSHTSSSSPPSFPPPSIPNSSVSSISPSVSPSMSSPPPFPPPPTPSSSSSSTISNSTNTSNPPSFFEILQCISRFLSNITQDDWSRKMLIECNAQEIISQSISKLNTYATQLKNIHNNFSGIITETISELTEALQNFQLPISQKTIEEMERHYNVVDAYSPSSTQIQNPNDFTRPPLGQLIKVSTHKVQSKSSPTTSTSAQSPLPRDSKRPQSLNSNDNSNDNVKKRTTIGSISITSENSSENNSDTTDDNNTNTHEVDEQVNKKPSNLAPGQRVKGAPNESPKIFRTATLPTPSSSSSSTFAQVNLDGLALKPQVKQLGMFREKRATFSHQDGPIQVRRKRVARELLETEESYVKSLLMLNILMINPSKKLLKPEQIECLFGGIEEIFSMSSAFLGRLRERMKDWNWNTQLADILLNLATKLPSYSIFINKYSQAMTTYAEVLEQVPAYKAKVQQLCEQQFPSIQPSHCAGHFFIMPVQRIPRYILLLEDLVKCTTTQHPDFRDIGQALEKIKQVANEINATKKAAEDSAAISNLEQKLTGYPGTLVKPGRVFLFEGSLIRLARADKGRYKNVYVYLFLLSDQILETVQQRRNFQYKSTIPVVDIKKVVADTTLDDEKREVFPFRIQLNGEDYILRASSDILRTQWINAIEKARPKV